MVGDGRPLLIFVGLILALVGVFALFLALTRHFLPHDIQYLGCGAEELCAMHGCRVVHFMMHDRASFGGALVAIGLLYLWLAYFPLHDGEAWAWWLFLISGMFGFASFLAYLGYGYLDTWHGVATLFLLPCYVIGMALTYRNMSRSRLSGGRRTPSRKRPSGLWGRPFSRERIGQAFLLGAGLGMFGGGCMIALVGMTSVFVPQDLAYMGIDVAELQRLNPRLVPLIAHDRAGFGGAMACTGMLVVGCVWLGRPSRHLWQALLIAGIVGFTPAIGIHFVIGYEDPLHLAPAVGGALLYGLGLLLLHRQMCSPIRNDQCGLQAFVAAY